MSKMYLFIYNLDVEIEVPFGIFTDLNVIRKYIKTRYQKYIEGEEKDGYTGVSFERFYYSEYQIYELELNKMYGGNESDKPAKRITLEEFLNE